MKRMPPKDFTALPDIMIQPDERLAALVARFSPPDVPPVAPPVGLAAPYLGFYSGRGDRAAAQADALGAPALGTAYVSRDGDYYSVHHTPWVLTDYLTYWATLDGANQKTWVSLKPQVWRAQHDGQNVVACVLGLFVLIGAPFSPGFSVVGDLLRDTKTGAIGQRVREVAAAQTDDWARAHPDLASLPLYMRLTSRWKAVTKPGANGPYAVLSSTSAPISAVEAKLLAAWFDSPECQQGDAAAIADFARRRDVITEQARCA